PRSGPLASPAWHRPVRRGALDRRPADSPFLPIGILMTETSFTSPCFARSQGSQASKRPQRVRPRVEELEGRVVPSYFPSTTNGIHIIEDQLPGGLSGAMVRFVATHTDGTQKETLGITNQFRAINPDYTVLHYQLGTGNSAYDYIINNQWSSDFGYVNQQEGWFAHQ